MKLLTRSCTNRGAALRKIYWSLLLFVAAGLTIGMWWLSPSQDFAPLKRGPVPETWAHKDDQEQEAKAAHQLFRAQHHYLPLNAVASDLKLAILVGEDVSFFGHGPIDPEAMWEALQQWICGTRKLRGASTISQQLAKNLYLSNARSWWRKIDEFRLAYWLEEELSKRRIFEIYINVIEFGPGIYGVDAACHYYFGHGAQTVTADEAASLAAAIPGPSHSNPKTQTRAWQRRREAIVSRVRHLDMLRRWTD